MVSSWPIIPSMSWSASWSAVTSVSRPASQSVVKSFHGQLPGPLSSLCHDQPLGQLSCGCHGQLRGPLSNLCHDQHLGQLSFRCHGQLLGPLSSLCHGQLLGQLSCRCHNHPTVLDVHPKKIQVSNHVMASTVKKSRVLFPDFGRGILHVRIPTALLNPLAKGKVRTQEVFQGLPPIS